MRQVPALPYYLYAITAPRRTQLRHSEYLTPLNATLTSPHVFYHAANLGTQLGHVYQLAFAKTGTQLGRKF